MIKVKNTVNIYELGGKELKSDDEPKKIEIHSHWNRNEFICIELPGFSKLTVCARDLKAAIDNATNTVRF